MEYGSGSLPTYLPWSPPRPVKSLPTYLPPDGRPEALPSSPSETDGAERFGTPPTPPLRAKDAMLGLDSESCIERNRCKFFNSYKLPASTTCPG